MKSLLLLIATSLMLVGATIAVAIPNTAEAAPKFHWCYTSATLVCSQNGDPFDNRGECNKAEKEENLIVTESCHKVPIV